jgi:hypothetical protein
MVRLGAVRKRFKDSSVSLRVVRCECSSGESIGVNSNGIQARREFMYKAERGIGRERRISPFRFLIVCETSDSFFMGWEYHW